MKRVIIEKAAEATGWNVTIDKRNKKEGGGYDIAFQIYTDFGQDVNEEFWIKHLEDIKHEVYERWYNFDPNEEASMWLDNTGHGKNGAPHDMVDVLNDMKEVENALDQLCEALYGRFPKKPKKADFVRMADELEQQCLSALLQNIHRARPAKFGVDAKGFDNPDKCSKYEEIIYLYGRWTLVDGDGLQYSINVMPLEEICRMVDAIINRKEE